MKKYLSNRENQLIILVWTLVYALNLLYAWYADAVNGTNLNWDKLLDTWAISTVFLILFLIHHYFLLPLLFLRKRYIAYSAAIIICIGSFTAKMVSHKPQPFIHKKEHRMPDRHAPRMLLAPPDMARLIIAIMMLGVDLGGMAWIKSMKLRRRLLLLEQQNLKQELEHLRYQINPHFFMNTLNNIHVLVDVDQERAKQAIIELSGLMRHSLYNGSESLTALQNEIEFLRQYISLMQLRFGNRVKLSTDIPDAPSFDIMIPPLLFATFVENAFKHGISYQTASFINIRLNVDREKSTIFFWCENSCNTTKSVTHDGYHGIGLLNVRKRLDLQYNDRYALNINNKDPQRFTVELTLPIL